MSKDNGSGAAAAPEVNEAQVAADPSELAVIAFQEAIERGAGLRALASVVGRAVASSKLGLSFDGDRDYYNELGYPLNPSFDDYYLHYLRDGLARRIVRFPATESFRRRPIVRDGGEPDNPGSGAIDTAFVKQFNERAKKLKLWNNLRRLDIAAGIGQYGVLFLGFSGEEALTEPVTDGAKLVYLRPLTEGSAEIKTVEVDPKSPRFGLPLTYEVDFTAHDQPSMTAVKREVVHYSRVIHVAEDPLENEVYGTPRLQPVINQLYDLLKVTGGSAETFWEVMNRGLHADLRDEYDLDPTQEDDLEDEIAAYYHKLRRIIQTRGIDIKELGTSSPPDPKPNFEVISAIVSAATNIPRRKLFGSERGELASTQDDLNWASYVLERQTNFVLPRIIEPVIQLLIDRKEIAAPTATHFTVEFESLFELTPLEIADLNLKRAQTLREAAPTTADLIVSPQEIRVEFLGMTEEIPGGTEAEQLDREAEDDIPDNPEDLPEDPEAGKAA